MSDRGKRLAAEREFADAGAFVVRRPLLPFADLERLGDGLAARAWATGAAGGDSAALAEAVAHDEEVLDTRLRELLSRPAVREAILLASPSLHTRIDKWLGGDRSDRRSVVRAVMGYITRMASRSTPFGLFAGCGVGRLSERTELALPPVGELRRASRIDVGFLTKVIARLEADREARGDWMFFPNSSLYRAGGRLRLAERAVGPRGVSYHRIAVEEDEALAAVLDRATAGASLAELAKVLVDDDVTFDEALEYAHELVDAQLLVSELGPEITGSDPGQQLIARLEGGEGARAVAGALARADTVLRKIDACGVGAHASAYDPVIDAAREVGVEDDLGRLVRVELFSPAPRLTFGPVVVREFYRAVDVLKRVSRTYEDESIRRFASRFAERYENREIPLAEALDEEIGIGFGPATVLASEGAPLLAGIAPPRSGGGGGRWQLRDAYLLRLLHRTWSEGATELALSDDDVARLEDRESPPRLPDALSVGGTLIAASADDVDRGQFQVLLQGAVGPTGARLLARFATGDADIEALVRRHVAQEQQAWPEVILAEVVHLPEGRYGNFLARPVLRTHEIPFLGTSGASRECLLGIDDLLVSVRNGRVVLRSVRLRREVVPRLTNAHNHDASGLQIYRFFGALQSQATTPSLVWHWGMLDAAPFLPRVTHGRLILSRARWLLADDDLKELGSTRDSAGRFVLVQRLRQARQLPRWSVVLKGDNELPVDLDTVAGCDLFAHEARRANTLRVAELLPAPDGLCMGNDAGRFFHEVVLPICRRPRLETGRVPIAIDKAQVDVEAPFLPGSDWLTVKLYTGQSSADLVLREVLPGLLREVRRHQDFRSWFFLRFNDPEWHLRVRFQGASRWVASELIPLLTELLSPTVSSRLVARVDFSTYARETWRYGGPEGVLVAERLFHHDSEAVAAIVGSVETDAGLDVRWRLALRGVDRLLDDFRFALADRQVLVRSWRDSFVAEHGTVGVQARQWSGRLFRQERSSLQQLLADEPTTDELAPGLAALRTRSRSLAPLVDEVYRLADTGRMTKPVSDVVGSFCHMHVNRSLRGALRTQEMVIYDLLDRLYSAARSR